MADSPEMTKLKERMPGFTQLPGNMQRQLEAHFQAMTPAEQDSKLEEHSKPRSGAVDPSFNKAIGYVDKVKTRFAGGPEYQHFLTLIGSYADGDGPSFGMLSKQISDLFKNEPDLVEEWKEWTPEAWKNRSLI